MIDIVTALGAEARPLTEAFHLKRRSGGGRFRIYENEEETIRLTVTGTGGVLSAAAVGMLLGQAHEIKEGHFLISFGTCARISGPGKTSADDGMCRGRLYLGNKLVNTDSRRVFYPDLLIRENIPEAEILTGSRVLRGSEDTESSEDSEMMETVFRKRAGTKEEQPDAGAVLYDMESAAVYEAGSCFLGPHEMGFLRVVTDAGDGENVTAQDVDRCVRNILPGLLSYIKKAELLLESKRAKETEAELEEACAVLSEDLKCSVTMRHQLMQTLRYFTAAKIPWRSAVRRMYDDGTLPARSRAEGKKALERLVSGTYQVRT